MLKTVGNPSVRYGDQTIENGGLLFGQRAAFSAVKNGNVVIPNTLGAFTYTLSASRAYSIYLIEVWLAATQTFNAPGFATVTNRWMFALKREGGVITASAVNADASSNFVTSNPNYAIAATPSVAVLSATQARFDVAFANGAALNLGAIDYVTQTRVLGELPMTIS